MDENYTYIVRCADGTLYTGWTNDLKKRIKAHNAGKGAKYTKTRRPVELVYFEHFATKEEAMSREYHIKQLKRAQKQALIDEIHLTEAFASAGLDSGSNWRFTGHLAGLALYYEFKDAGCDLTAGQKEVTGKYMDNFKRVWDMYTNTSAADKATLDSGSLNAESELGMEEAVFYQNGDWEYANFADDNENGYTVKQSDLSMMPIYFGVDDENEGLAVGTENHWTVNAKADQKDIDATLEFLNWVITSDDGRDAIVNKMGLSAPFDTFTGDYESKNAFANVASELAKEGKTSVAWSFNATPSVDDWRADFLAPLTEYTERNGSWDDVAKAFSEKWAYYWDLQNEQ